MHDTIWNGKTLKMVDSKGSPKGMRLILEERGVDVKGLKADNMRKKLKDMRDFKYEKTKVETLITDRRHRCIFIPKHHCELNPIERVWGHAKQYTQKHCDYTFSGLEKTIGPALDSVSIGDRRAERIFRNGHVYGTPHHTAPLQRRSRTVLELTRGNHLFKVGHNWQQRLTRNWGIRWE